MLVTVVELPEFQRRAKAVMSEAEKTALIAFVAENPDAGVSLGGGLRKFRFARDGGGKSGGYRVVHVWHPGDGPVFLLTVFAKNEKANLTRAETATLAKLGEALATEYGKRR
jgi:hypothetical protein